MFWVGWFVRSGFFWSSLAAPERRIQDGKMGSKTLCMLFALHNLFVGATADVKRADDAAPALPVAAARG